MIYAMHQAREDAAAALRLFARLGAQVAWREGGAAEQPHGIAMRWFGALCDQVAVTTTTYERPPFRIDSARIGNRAVDVVEEVALDTPFASLLHFRKDTGIPQPRVLLVAPMSGHFATLLRGTVITMLPDHDVYITDWKNAREIPVSDGLFGLDDYIDHIIRFQERIGPRGHIVAVCQPTVAALAAVAVMSQHANPATPRSMTLMAGPLDTRVNPTRVNELAKSRPLSWFEQNVIDRVPLRYKGATRRVYPGFMQLQAFVSMNLDRHISAHLTYFRNEVAGNREAAALHRTFYDEYNAVMDMPAEFFLETIERIFQHHDLPLGKFTFRGEPIRPEAIRRTALLTVEGENDDICAIGQTAAALDLCARIKPAMKRHHLQTGVGHYGVFNGRRWNTEIYPLMREMIEVMN